MSVHTRILVAVLTSVAILSVSSGGLRAQKLADGGVGQAAEELSRGEFESAEKTVRKSLLAPGIDRAEAYRVLGLALFFQDRILEARAAFLEYLRTDPDAHLDPALVPPEAITLFEDVRARNLAEIEALRPKPKRKRYLLLNLVPGAGQRQNGETTKGIIIAVGLGSLLAANLGSYYWLEKNCDDVTRVCGSADDDRAGTARNLQTLNQLSGVAAIGLYGYAIIDGYLGYRAAERAERAPTRNHMRYGLVPTQGGASARLVLSF